MCNCRCRGDPLRPALPICHNAIRTGAPWWRTKLEAGKNILRNCIFRDGFKPRLQFTVLTEPAVTRAQCRAT